MKILIVSNYLLTDENYSCKTLCQLLMEKGHEIFLLTTKDNNNLNEKNIPNIKVIKGNYFNVNNIYKKLLNDLNQNKVFDLCFVYNNFHNNMIALKLKRKFNIPYIIKFSKMSKHNNFLNVIYERVLKYSEGIIVENEKQKKYIKKLDDNKKIQVITNAVDTDKFNPNYYNIDKNYFNILYLSNNLKQEDIYKIVDLIKNLEEKYNKIKLSVVGKSCKSLKINYCFSKIKDCNKMEFFGYKEHDKLIKYYNEADLLFTNKNDKELSNVILEAMACGLPIMKFASNGCISIGSNICFTGSACGEKIIDLLTNNEFLKKSGEKNRQLVVENYSWNKIIDKYIDFFTEIVEEKNEKAEELKVESGK